jgi:hypothetical protein
MTLAGSMKLRNFLLMVVLVGAGGVTVSYMACSKKHDDPKITNDDRNMTKPSVPPVTDIRPAVPPPTPMPDAAVAASSDLAARAYDADVLAWRTKTAPKGKIKDAAPKASYKLDLYQDAGKSTIDRAKLDANRNGKWDDKYTFDGETITLEHAPGDDEKYTEKYHWNGSGWTKAQ